MEMGCKNHKVSNLIIFASGNGSNAARIIDYFSGRQDVEITYVLSNKSQAPVLEKAQKRHVKALSFNKASFYDGDVIFELLKENNPDFIILAGFLWLIPQKIVSYFSGKIINLHPALLPKFGGKGMYGNRVHQAVIENREKESGITVHYVNKDFDEGKIIAQFAFELEGGETVESLKAKIKQLEHAYFPKVIDELIQENNG